MNHCWFSVGMVRTERGNCRVGESAVAFCGHGESEKGKLAMSVKHYCFFVGMLRVERGSLPCR